MRVTAEYDAAAAFARNAEEFLSRIGAMTAQTEEVDLQRYFVLVGTLADLTHIPLPHRAVSEKMNQVGVRKVRKLSRVQSFTHLFRIARQSLLVLGRSAGRGSQSVLLLKPAVAVSYNI